MISVMITGGAGFIGSHIAECLVNLGYDVFVLDNFFTGKRSNLSEIEDKIEIIESDITDLDSLRDYFRNMDFVLHHAALRSVPVSMKNSVEYFKVNVQGTINVLQASLENGVKRVVFASSSSVYGDSSILPQKEGCEGRRLSPYAETKFVGEQLCSMYSRLYCLETVCLRYFNVFGPKQDPNSQYSAVIPLFIKSFLNKKQPTIFGDGSQSRDFTYIDNIIRANILAMTAENSSGEIFNIANGDSVSINYLASKIASYLNVECKPIFSQKREGDVLMTKADNAKAKEKLGYSQKVSFDEGLIKSIKWFAENSVAQPKECVEN